MQQLFGGLKLLILDIIVNESFIHNLKGNTFCGSVVEIPKIQLQNKNCSYY